MSDSSIIREFLVGLGFKVDKDSAEKFTGALKSGTTAAVALGEVIAKVAEAVARAVLKMAQDMDQLYFTSRRVNAAAENIKAFGFALTQLGGSAQGAQSALEGIASFMRSNPGGERYIQALGVQTRDVNGNLRDTEQIAEDLGKRFSEMPFYMAKVRAAMLGIDEKTLLAMENPKVGAEAGKYRSFAALFGLGPDWADQSNQFFTKLRDVEAELSIIVIAIANRLLPIAQRFIDFLSQLPLYVDAFRRSDLGGALMDVFDALGPVIKDMVQIAEIIGKHVIPQVSQLASVALKQLVDELHFVRDVLVLIDHLLHGTATWTDWQKSATDAMRAVAHMAEGLVLVLMKLNPFSNMALQTKARADMDALIDQYLPPGTPGAPAPAPAAGAAAPSLGDPGTNLLGPGGAPETTPGVTWKQKLAAGITAYMNAHGINAATSQGIGAGVYGEGGGLGFSKNGAFGLGQWRGARLRALFARYGRNPTFDQQAAFLLSELLGGDPGGSAVITAPNAAAALWAYADKFMRPDLPGQGHGQAMGDFNRGRHLLGAGSAANVAISQKTDIHIHEVSDARRAAHHVETAQHRVNSNLVRNLKVAVA